MQSKHNGEQRREHDFSEFLWFILCCFGRGCSSHIAGFRDYARRCITHDYTLCPCYIPVLVLEHKQTYRAEPHLFQPCQGQESV